MSNDRTLVIALRGFIAGLILGMLIAFSVVGAAGLT